MSNWKFLEQKRVTVVPAGIPAAYASDSSFGFNGMFRFTLDTLSLRCIASDGMGWQHVSVSIEGERKPPPWGIMAKVKDLFWEPEDVVVQFHPKKSEYVNNHSGCLHLWRCIDGREFPTPPSIMVGYKP